MGCHFCHVSVRDISALLDLPGSIIAKRKHRNLPLSGRLRELKRTELLLMLSKSFFFGGSVSAGRPGTGSPEWNAAIGNVISYTCVFPAATCRNVCCGKKRKEDLLISWTVTQCKQFIRHHHWWIIRAFGKNRKPRGILFIYREGNKSWFKT